jgi:hypothetical protein
MRFDNRSICRRCARGMREVVSIEPNGCTPGLVAFLCAGCGSTASILVHPVSRRREMNHMHQREQFDYLNSPVSELR